MDEPFSFLTRFFERIFHLLDLLLELLGFLGFHLAGLQGLGDFLHFVFGFFEIAVLERLGHVFGGSLIEVLKVRKRLFHLFGISEGFLLLCQLLFDFVQIGYRFFGSKFRFVLEFLELFLDPFILFNRFEISLVFGILKLLLNRLENRLSRVFDVGGFLGRRVG